MGRPKLKIWKYFNAANLENNKEVWSCKFCSKAYITPSGKRLQSHLKVCLHCPDDIKALFSDSQEPESEMEVDNPLPLLPPPSGSGSGSGVRNVIVTDTDQPGTSCGKIASAAKKLCQRQVSSFMDSPLTPQQKKEIDEAFANAAFYAGLPFRVFEENPYFQIALKKLRPSYMNLPSRKHIANGLLNGAYAGANESAAKRIKSADCLTIMSDGWTNQRNEGILNFMVGTPDIVFHSAVDTGENHETAQYVADQALEVIDNVGSRKVALFTTDNAMVMRAAWKLIQEKYPHIITARCVDHGLDLLCEDIGQKIKRFATIRQNARAVVKIRCRRVTKAVFVNIQKKNYGSNCKALCLPSKTRFFGDVAMYDSILVNKQALLETAVSTLANINPSTKRIILDDNFWQDLEELTGLLRPIAKGINVLEGNKERMSLVPIVFMDIINNIMAKLSESHFSENVCDTVKAKLQNRINFCVKDVHKAAYLVDPRFRGAGLSDIEKLDCIELILKMSQHFYPDKNIDDVRQNILDFQSKLDFFVRNTLWDMAVREGSSPIQWWSVLCASQPMSAVAQILLQLHPTSCSCERVWSDFGYIHSKIRNRLKNERVQKLVAVRKHLQGKVKEKESESKEINKEIEYYKHVNPVPLMVHFDEDNVIINRIATNNNESDSDSISSLSEVSDSDGSDGEWSDVSD